MCFIFPNITFYYFLMSAFCCFAPTSAVGQPLLSTPHALDGNALGVEGNHSATTAWGFPQGCGCHA